MKQYIQLYCLHCHHDDLVKNGHSENGTQRYVCKGCGRSFQWEYTYNAWIPEVKEQIETQTFNGSCPKFVLDTISTKKYVNS